MLRVHSGAATAPIWHSGLVEEAIPVLRTADVTRAVAWYQRLGYDQEWEHRFEPAFPAVVSISRKGDARIFLSEHTGDALPDGLIYLRVSELASIAVAFDTEIVRQPWGREVHIVDPDGNRLRIGETAQNG
jgi:catechol 2,3-dioxygenase-like lactoylglutathione lyase family enzyme